jgi:hypothetical protein
VVISKVALLLRVRTPPRLSTLSNSRVVRVNTLLSPQEHTVKFTKVKFSTKPRLSTLKNARVTAAPTLRHFTKAVSKLLMAPLFMSMRPDLLEDTVTSPQAVPVAATQAEESTTHNTLLSGKKARRLPQSAMATTAVILV